MEDQGECMLVLIGATPEGKKELIDFQVGVRESAQSRRELLIDVKQRGLQIAPEIAVGDGALGFWKALEEVFPGTSDAGCTKPSMSWTRSTLGAGHHEEGSARGRRQTERPPKRRPTSLRKNTAPNKDGQSNAWSRIATLCWPSTTFPPSIGITCVRWTSDFFMADTTIARHDDCRDRCKSILLFGCAAGHSSVPAM